MCVKPAEASDARRGPGRGVWLSGARMAQLHGDHCLQGVEPGRCHTHLASHSVCRRLCGRGVRVQRTGHRAVWLPHDATGGEIGLSLSPPGHYVTTSEGITVLDDRGNADRQTRPGAAGWRAGPGAQGGPGGPAQRLSSHLISQNLDQSPALPLGKYDFVAGHADALNQSGFLPLFLSFFKPRMNGRMGVGWSPSHLCHGGATRDQAKGSQEFRTNRQRGVLAKCIATQSS